MSTQEEIKNGKELYEQIRGTLDYERTQNERRMLEMKHEVQQAKDDVNELKAELKTTRQNLNWAQDRLAQRKQGDRVLIEEEPMPSKLTQESLEKFNKITSQVEVNRILKQLC